MSMIRTSLLALAAALLIAGAASALAASRGRLQGGACRGGSRQQGSRRLAQSMDHDGGGDQRREEGRRDRRLRQGGGVGERSRSAGKGIDLPGHQREEALERPGNPLRRPNGVPEGSAIAKPSLRAQRSNPALLQRRKLDCFVAALLAMTENVVGRIRHRMTIRRRDFLTLAGAAALAADCRGSRAAPSPASTSSNASAMRASCT